MITEITKTVKGRTVNVKHIQLMTLLLEVILIW